MEHILEREQSDVPKVVVDLIAYLDEFGLDDVGLFRIPGTSTTVKKLRYEYNQSYLTGKYVLLNTVTTF